MSHISTHILDTSLGRPAAQVGVKLRVREGGEWKELERLMTNADGRAVFSELRGVGTYQILFEVDSYFSAQKRESFYLTIPVVFQIVDLSRNTHVPLLLSPYSYSTYRGS